MRNQVPRLHEALQGKAIQQTTNDEVCACGSFAKIKMGKMGKMSMNNLVQDLVLKGSISTHNKIESLKGKCKSFIRANDGVTAVEYAIVVAGVAAIVLFVFGDKGPVKEMLNGTFTSLKTKVDAAINGGGTP